MYTLRMLSSLNKVGKGTDTTANVVFTLDNDFTQRKYA